MKKIADITLNNSRCWPMSTRHAGSSRCPGELKVDTFEVLEKKPVQVVDGSANIAWH